MSEEHVTGSHPAAPSGAITSETLKTIGAIVSLLTILAGAVAWAAAIKTELTEFRQQYSRDTTASERNMAVVLRRLDTADEARERVRVLETQRASDEREWRGRGEDVVRRLTGLEDEMRRCGCARRPQ